jgi:hypothetical protein
MEPINYSAQIANPMQAAVQGLQLGSGLQQMQMQQQAQQQALQQQQMRQQSLGELMRNPNPSAQDYVRVASLMPPEQAKQMMTNWETLSKDQQSSQLSFGGQVMAAFQAKQPEIGIDLLKQRAEAAKNSGRQDQAQMYGTWAQLAELNPDAAAKSIGTMIAALPGGDKTLEGLGKLGTEARAQELQPALVAKGQAEATTKAVEAKYADSMAAQELSKKGWDITKLQEDIKINKFNSQIAAMNAATAKETNALKRDELKLQIQDKLEKRDSAIREKAAEVESARADMDNFLNTADRILKTPAGAIKAATGPVDARMPTMQRDVADFEALVETLGSQAFMAQIPKMKGTGALSEGEGKKLQASLQNLSLSQSPDQLLANVKEAQRLILKGRSLLAKKAGIPDTVPDTPAAAPSGSDIDALLKKYGGK